MSDEEKKETKPTPETASVPLKKETIRVTLRANPDAEDGADASDAPAPPKPEAPKPEAPKAPAPTIPIGGGAPKPAAPAPTVKLNTPSKPIVPGGETEPATPSPTKPLGEPASKPSGPGLSQPLPKATVNLGTTPLPSTPTTDSSSQPTATVEGDTEPVALEEENQVPAIIMSVILVLVAGIAAFFAFQTSQITDKTPFFSKEKQQNFLSQR